MDARALEAAGGGWTAGNTNTPLPLGAPALNQTDKKMPKVEMLGRERERQKKKKRHIAKLHGAVSASDMRYGLSFQRHVLCGAFS